jgi:hypothetical protein
MTSRRDVLSWLATSAAVPLLGRVALAEAVAFGRRVHLLAQQPGARSWRALDEQTGRLLVAACDGILPASDTPGATAAGVDRFIDRMLAEWYPAPERDAFLAGLRTLDVRSRERHGRDFTEVTAEGQAAILEALDDEAASRDKGAHWFARLKELTIWGYFTSEIVLTSLLHENPMGTGRFDGCVPTSGSPEHSLS